MIRMVAGLRTVLFVVAVLTFTRIAYAQDINITIQGDPWKPSPLEARKQYLRGREADEMIRKGYVCYREVGSSECSWERPSSSRSVAMPTARWGKCVQAFLPVKGRMCERITSGGHGASYYDFERPLVLLEEEIHDARIMAESDNPFFPGDATQNVRDLQRMFLKKAEDLSKRLAEEQQRTLERTFENTLQAARKSVFRTAPVLSAGGKDGSTASGADPRLAYSHRRIQDEQKFGTDANFVCLFGLQSEETKSGSAQKVQSDPTAIRHTEKPSPEICSAEREENRAADADQKLARPGHESAEAAERSDKARASLENCEEKHRADEFRSGLGGQAKQPSDSLDDEPESKRACTEAVERRTEDRRKTATSRPLRELLAIPLEYRLAEEVDRLALEEANSPGSTQATPTTRRRLRKVEAAASR